MKENIGVLINTYIRPSEVFIYELIRAVTKYNVHVFARSVTNKSVFYDENIHSIAAQSHLEVLTYTLTRNSPFLNKAVSDNNIKLC